MNRFYPNSNTEEVGEVCDMFEYRNKVECNKVVSGTNFNEVYNAAKFILEQPVGTEVTLRFLDKNSWLAVHKLLIKNDKKTVAKVSRKTYPYKTGVDIHRPIKFRSSKDLFWLFTWRVQSEKRW